MRLSAFFQNVGHPIAYYAKLNNITGSATATLFISQFLYWEGKQRDPDGWIYKTQAEIQEETGLNRREQESARKQLKALGLLQERRVGLPARLEFLPVLDELDRQWELYLSHGSSIALTEKQQEAERKIQNFGSANSAQKASNPHDCQIVRTGQTCVSEPSKQDCPTRTDNLYTEITNREYSTEIISKAAAVKRSVPETQPSLGNSVNQESDTKTTSKSSSVSTASIKSKEGVPLFSEKRKLGGFHYDKNGWLQLPKGVKYKLPRAIATRRIQMLVAIAMMDDVAEWVTDNEDRILYEDGERLVNCCFSGLELPESEAFNKTDDLSLKALRTYGEQYYNLDQDEVNELLKTLFEDSLRWCQQMGDRATEMLNKHSLADLFWDKDSAEFYEYDEAV